ncbi:MAG: aminotransferase class I/II-fold pyridoxal phosphate-dependent enzyme [Candidatus Eisenbacteria bacterium]|nr:aminotransferase class I/II-fold pyridoxal phosphate-dependent enzyme [Candidatus Eisenbacteria bacterium]
MRPRNPAYDALATYPFVRLEDAKRAAAERGLRILDFGMGDPQERTPERIRRALLESVPDRASYPPAAGLPQLRRAMAAWVERRFGVRLDPDLQILPSNGSKEAVYLLHQSVVDPRGERRIVWIPDPAYPVYEIGARFAGGIPEPLPLLEPRGFLPDLDAIPPEQWRRTALLWLNYPNNPTGAVAGLDLYEKALALAREHGFWVASDEAYSELWFDQPPAGAIQAGIEGLVVLNTLSKRSAMTGYRSGLIAGDPELIRLLRMVRPSQGVATPLFVQGAAIAAWEDEAHVAEQRRLYQEKRDVLLPVLRRKGIRVAGSDATFYLWFQVPGGRASEAFAAWLLESGIVVTPGSYFGARGEGYARMALVPTLELCREAAALLEKLL